METAQKTSIPQQIVFDIFSYLPVKSLMRFKCISKFHNSLISDPYFIENHQSHFIHLPNKTKFLAFSTDDYENSFHTINLGQTPQVSNFCIEKLDLDMSTRTTYAKGLLCIWNVGLSDPAIIINPSTREKRSLPNCLSLLSVADDEKLVNYGTSCYSLGLDPIKKRHKVLMSRTYRNKMRNWVFTLGTPDESYWREIKSSIPCVRSLLLEGVDIDGVVYFFGDYYYSNNQLSYYEKKLCLVGFNVITEEFKIVSVLWDENVYSSECFYRYQLIEVKGKLGVMAYSTRIKPLEIKPAVWILQNGDGHEEWVHQEFAEEEDMCINGENIVLVNPLIKPNFIFLFDLKNYWWRSIEILELARKERREVTSMLTGKRYCSNRDRVIGIYSYNEDSLYSL